MLHDTRAADTASGFLLNFSFLFSHSLAVVKLFFLFMWKKFSIMKFFAWSDKNVYGGGWKSSEKPPPSSRFSFIDDRIKSITFSLVDGKLKFSWVFHDLLPSRTFINHRIGGISGSRGKIDEISGLATINGQE